MRLIISTNNGGFFAKVEVVLVFLQTKDLRSNLESVMVALRFQDDSLQN